MLNWLKRNYFIVLLVASIVALSLTIVPIYNLIDLISNSSSDEYKTSLWMSLVYYVGLGLAEVVFIIIASRRSLDKKFIILAILLYFVSDIAVSVYRLIANQSYTAIYSIAINAALIIFMILSLSDRRYFFTTLIILLIDAAPALLGTFSGSEIDFSALLLDFMLLSAIYFFGASDQSNTDYNYYS